MDLNRKGVFAGTEETSRTAVSDLAGPREGPRSTWVRRGWEVEMRKVWIGVGLALVLGCGGCGVPREQAEGTSAPATTEGPPPAAGESPPPSASEVALTVPFGCQLADCSPSTPCQEPNLSCFVYDLQLMCCESDPFECLPPSFTCSTAHDCSEYTGFPVCRNERCCPDGSAAGRPLAAFS